MLFRQAHRVLRSLQRNPPQGRQLCARLQRRRTWWPRACCKQPKGRSHPLLELLNHACLEGGQILCSDFRAQLVAAREVVPPSKYRPLKSTDVVAVHYYCDVRAMTNTAF